MRLTLALSLLVAAPLESALSQPSGEFVELFDGTLRGWSVENTELDNFRVIDGLLRVEAPQGWLRSAATYSDFELRIEFRFLTDDADSGVFFRVAGSEPFARGWPDHSYQLQMLNPLSPSPFQPLGGLFRHGMLDGETEFDEPLARRVTRPTGEWQGLELAVSGRTLIASINGTQVLSATGIGNGSGYIGLQGETGALEFRLIEIRVL